MAGRSAGLLAGHGLMPRPARAVLIRHGETDWNRAGRSLGQADVPLNEAGRRQAALAARALSGLDLDAVYASDLRRCVETARIIAAPRGLPVQGVPGLREVDLADWSGRTDAEIAREFPEQWLNWMFGRPGWRGGETYQQMADRVVAAMSRLAASHQGGSIAVVGHKGTIIAVLAKCSGTTAHEMWLSRPRIRHATALSVQMWSSGWKIELADN